MKILDRLFRRDAGVETEETERRVAPDDVQYREASIRQDDIEDEARTVDIAISSDTPLLRSFFGVKWNETLVHDEKSVRLDRMRDGAAVLMDHNHRDQIGVIENARIEEGKLRATVRFSKSARATEIFQDVQDGIRTKISVGYRIYGYEERDGGANGVDEIRITDWEPMEASFVSIPADTTVGVGRADSHPIPVKLKGDRSGGSGNSTPAAISETDMPNPTKKADESRQEQPGEQANERAAFDAEIDAIGEKFNEPDLAREVKELGGTPDDLKKQILAKRNNVKPIPQRDSTPFIDVREKYTGKLRGFRSEEDAYRAGQWARSWMFGDRRAWQWCKDHGMRVMTEGSLTKGGAVVPHEMSQAIIDLREEYGVMRQLLRVVPMTSDQLNVPRRTGGLTAYAVGEEDEITASDKSWDNITLAPKKWGVLAKFSTDYAEDAIIDVAQDLADEAAYAFAQKEDECAIDGDGTSTYHGIQGFRHKLNASALAGRIDATAGDDQFSELIASDLDGVRGVLPQYAQQRGRVVWLASKYAKNVVFDGITRAAGGNTQMMLGGNLVDAYLGDEIAISQAMPSASTAYDELIMLLYGNFALAATLGDRRSFTFKVLNERYAEFDQIGILATTRFDVVVHDLGDTSDAGPVVGLRGNTS